MNTIIDRIELMEHLTWAFTSGLNSILLDFDKMKVACVADFSRRMGGDIPDDAITYINRIYKGLAEVYEMGRRAGREAVTV